MLQTLELSESQEQIEHFVRHNTSVTVDTNKIKRLSKGARKKKVKRNHVKIKQPGDPSKIMIVCGDTILARDFIVNDLKPQFDLDLQIVTGIVKRNAATFKSQIIEGSQCNATYKKIFPGLGSKPKLDGFLGPVKEESDNAKYLTKVQLFEDFDTVFVDETDFYS